MIAACVGDTEIRPPAQAARHGDREWRKARHPSIVLLFFGNPLAMQPIIESLKSSTHEMRVEWRFMRRGFGPCADFRVGYFGDADPQDDQNDR